MKAKRFLFRAPTIFGIPLKYGVPVFVGFTFAVSGLTAEAGDILRGGGSRNVKPGRATGGAATPAATDAARANAKDSLARTNRTLESMRAMQNAARNAAIRNNAKPLVGGVKGAITKLPVVPNGIALGGLKPTANPKLWVGAQAPVQKVKKGKTLVTIKQTSQQALLNWDTFNVGKNTTLTFDQKKGGADVGKWIAFNRITDPSGNPTQILGKIKAAGQVYIINPNGIIFGAGSQVNARGLTASSLPINENLVKRGLLNNPDAQFLFSGLSIPGGTDGTPNFVPGPPPASGKYGDVTVQAGAVLKSPGGSGGDGGRIMLVGPNVTNNGTISTESGQTILAAGLQVGVAAHKSSDPSLRGLDVWIGAVGDGAGRVINAGLIDVPTGSAFLAGRYVDQLGAIDSTTSVSLNGRIDLKASYGAVGNPNFDNDGQGGKGAPMFFNQFTGVVTMGEGSVTRILPDYASDKKVPGTALPQKSQINVEGLTIHFKKNSTILAPSAEVSVRAGVWPFKDLDGNRTILDSNGKLGLDFNSYLSGTEQRFFFKDGQIYLDDAAVINVAGSSDVFVPLAQSILKVELRGPELADSPLIRDTKLKGVALTVDIRNTGVHNGKYWVGTPLGDVTGLVGLIERNAAQLTAVGGTINLQAGGSIVIGKSATLDVSGGSFKHEGGIVKTSALISDGKLVAIKDATPDLIYDGIFTGSSTSGNQKWGVTNTFDTPLISGTMQDSFIEGAAGGTLSLTAPSMVLDGKLRGSTITGPRQRVNPPGASTLRINFESEKELKIANNPLIKYIKTSPTPPAIVFSKNPIQAATPIFSLVGDGSAALPSSRTASVILSSKLLGKNGFGALEVLNKDGSITVPENVTLSTEPKGAVSFGAANILIAGSVQATGGKLIFNTYNLSPSFAEEYGLLNTEVRVPLPIPNADRGNFILGRGASLSATGVFTDDGILQPDFSKSKVIDGGSITINSFKADLAKGSEIDVSGGAYLSEKAQVSYGKGGIISVATGKDLSPLGVVGGGLVLDSTLSGYSGAEGGTLSIQAGLIQIGGSNRTGALNLKEVFFRQGGFAKYNLTGIGAASDKPSTGAVESYKPAISIAPGSKITPRATGLIAVQDSGGHYSLQRAVGAKGVRSPVSLTFTALGSDDPFTTDKLEVRGDIVMGKGAVISADAGASVSFKGGTVTLLGSVIAPGGVITVAGAGAFPFAPDQRASQAQALATVHIGSSVLLSTAGITELLPDAFGRRIGKVYDGGSISISGNILAESGSALDVSGTSGMLDLDPVNVAGQAAPAATAGLTSTPSRQLGVATRIDSNGGMIDLTGSQMLLVDSTLTGKAGGKKGKGGSLSVSSGNFYLPEGTRTGADVNLVVKQSGNFIKGKSKGLGVGIALTNQQGVSYGNSGFFAVDRFTDGKFASLSLGGKYLADATPISYGGNVSFVGKIDIIAKGSVRLAAGGVITANDTVKISSSYLSIGQDFRAPAHPNDIFLPFKIDPATTQAHYFPPTFGTGSLDLNAGLIDVGTLSLQNIGRANFTANNGDIRGNGTLSMAGDLSLKAAQVYPTTLGKFDIFAYDHQGVSGSVTIASAGKSNAPLSAGGSLSIYASEIIQGGVLRAPLGTIRLGWDGKDLDRSDKDLDIPRDAIAVTTIAPPVADQVTLTEGSLTSVSAKGLQIPFGISPDGLSWIDPRGVNVTLSGLPEKAVFVSGDKVKMDSGATVDIRGGGELLASRWVAGNGGSRDLLGTAGGEWGGGEYQPGALVTYKGETWSARVRHSGQTPGANLYWSKVAESYAIVPDFTSKFSPYAPFNVGSNASALAGNPGFINGNLKIGDTITLEASDGLPAGTYTLLPRAYAALKGAFLVTPVDNGSVGSFKAADGATYVSGYTGNNFNPTEAIPIVRSRFEIASAAVLKNRVTYDIYSASEFIAKAGGKQLLPTDAGYAAFHGNTGLQLSGSLLTQSGGLLGLFPGRGAQVDISSFADIVLTGGTGVAPANAPVALDTAVLASWEVESLLIGGVRSRGRDGTTVDVRTTALTLDNPGDMLSGPEIILVSDGGLTLTGQSSIASVGKVTGADGKILMDGGGSLLRVSGDASASIFRSGLASSATPLLTIGDSASIAGPSVILDSTVGTSLSPLAKLDATALTLNSGQINVVFAGAAGPSAGGSQLTLAGVTLDRIQQSQVLNLQSYGSIDFYGSGVLGGSASKQITLSGSGVRGYQQAGGQVVIRAADVFFENPLALSAPVASAVLSGGLKIDAATIHLGANSTATSNYSNVTLNATDKLLFAGDGAFSTAGNLTVNTPVITGAKGSDYAIRAGQVVSLTGGGGKSSLGELGASLTVEGTRISANTDILLPSGQLTLRATNGPLEIGGRLSVAGTSRTFNDLIRFSNAGTIRLESLTGGVTIAASGDISVAADTKGGEAGELQVIAPNGKFNNLGGLHGEGSVGMIGSSGGTSGSFLLDVKSLSPLGVSSFGDISAMLDRGGFFNSRNFRIRTGDVALANLNRSHQFLLSADQGSILVTGGIDASGKTGGAISLSAQGNLTLAPGAKLSTAALGFNSAGKGGSIVLEAGTQTDGVANPNALLDLQDGSVIDLGVDRYVAGAYTAPGSSAFEGKFTGTLHLRAPRTADNTDIQLGSINSTISGASSILAEGFKVYTPPDGILNIAQRNLINSEAISFLGAAGVGNANEVVMRGKLLTGADTGLDSLLVIAPGVEMVNPTGDLTLGLANPTGTTNVEGLAAADWDLSSFRYGSRSAPGVLTLRAGGDLVFNNTLSDGFTPIAQGSAQVFGDNGHSLTWLGRLMTIKDTLPTNTQSWSYRLTAGADVNASNFRSVFSASALDLGQPSKGSVIVGEFYPAVPNALSTASAAGIGVGGQTADSIRISTTATNRGTRFEVVRTGTGDITISAGRDIQLRNQFATIYTAGVALPTPTSIYQQNDFVLPVLPTTLNNHPSQLAGGTVLGAIQQLYPAGWSMAGGNISLKAGQTIGRYTLVNGLLNVDSSRQMPTNWLYRRGYVDPATGLFASDGGVDPAGGSTIATRVTDVATSTTWWIDYSNFFQGIGALGGGNVTLAAGTDVVNVDAVAPTNARMAGRRKNPDFGVIADAPEYLNLAPNEANLLELGGGDVTVTAGRNIDGGIYYVERGKGSLFAGGEITTNASRSPSLGILDGTAPLDPLTWMPTTLFVGKSGFEVSARGNVLVGPVSNPFLLPQGINNKFWYKTYFNTFSPDAGLTVASYGGDVTHRTEVTLPASKESTSILGLWYSNQNLFVGDASGSNASNFQPWLRLSDSNLGQFSSIFKLVAPNLRSTSFTGNLNLAGSQTLFPSATGDLELVAASSIIGLQDTGAGKVNVSPLRIWTAAEINVSDAAVESIPSIAAPLAYQSLGDRNRANAVGGSVDVLKNVSLSLTETGSSLGVAGTSAVKQALHDPELLHAGDANPIRLYSGTGDITGLALFSPKATRIMAGRDITDVAFYLQNISATDITLVSAGRDIVPFNENSAIRTFASDITNGNFVGGTAKNTVAGDSTSALAGDIQINGPGALEILAGRDLDLGTGANFADGTGVGITSIGNTRNPNLPFTGADIIALAGVSGKNGTTAANGLTASSLDFAAFIKKYIKVDQVIDSPYLKKLGIRKKFSKLTAEQQAIVALERFYQILAETGTKYAKVKNYKVGEQAVKLLFGKAKPVGDILTQARDIRTTTGGAISLGSAGGGITMANSIFGNPLTPPGIVTEYGGAVSTFTHRDVSIGQARIFTLRGGDITMWSSKGSIAAGSSARTVVTAPPTRVVIDITSADVQTDLGGLATGGGIGVLAAVEGVKKAKVTLVAPNGFIDAGDAGIRATGDITIAAPIVLNTGNISSGGTTTGGTPPVASTPSVGAVTNASNSSAAAGTTVVKPESGQPQETVAIEETLSIISVDVIGYGEASGDEEEEDEE